MILAIVLTVAMLIVLIIGSVHAIRQRGRRAIRKTIIEHALENVPESSMAKAADRLYIKKLREIEALRSLGAGTSVLEREAEWLRAERERLIHQEIETASSFTIINPTH